MELGIPARYTSYALGSIEYNSEIESMGDDLRREFEDRVEFAKALGALPEELRLVKAPLRDDDRVDGIDPWYNVGPQWSKFPVDRENEEGEFVPTMFGLWWQLPDGDGSDDRMVVAPRAGGYVCDDTVTFVPCDGYGRVIFGK